MDANKRKIVVAALEAGWAFMSEMANDEDEGREATDHRKKPRSNRRKFRHGDARHCINRDYLGIRGDLATPLLGAEFKAMFRVSRSRFQVLLEDIGASEIRFYQKKKNLDVDDQASLEAKLLLPIKTLAYGVPPHTFIDYFQMSPEYARECCRQFDIAVKKLYAQEYLRLPTSDELPEGLGRILHWKPGSPSIILEAVVDYHMFFWHASYGYTGNIGDLNVLAKSPLLERMVDGSFHTLENEASVVPFKIGDQEFTKCFILTDGIYPKFSRFVKGVKEPITEEEKKYTAWQEGARKDVERAVGVLKCTWQFLDRPILKLNLSEVAMRTTCCIILHNMLTADRVMGDPRARYVPCASLDECPGVGAVQQPGDLAAVQGIANIANNPTHAAAGAATAPANSGTGLQIGLRNAPPDLLQQVTRKDRFDELMQMNMSDFTSL
ncbi:plant transposon protein [Nitzschia inconspicua]|uniref:Plant transposon protein n=1 Tax=Nitzschia inconspicua TaxID=303405 RepID=A0A9K3KVZ7_9STRA|nr:plant transposon protein [Nitzschia inconspicua]